MTFRATVFFLVIAALISGCSERNTADERIRALFSIPASVPLDKPNIRAAVLKAIPIGTPQSEIRPTLQRLGVGNGTISTYYPPTTNNVGTLAIDYDLSTFGLVKNHYVIGFVFDRDQKLLAVVVDLLITGT